MRRDQVRRLERLECRLAADALEAVREFRLIWVEPSTEALPPGARIVRDSTSESVLEDWLRPGLRFRFETARERPAEGPDDHGRESGEPAGPPGPAKEESL